MKDLIDRALDAAQRGGAGYADVRVVERENEGLTVKNGALEAASSNRSAGLGIRVLVDGAWGFSSSALLEPDEAERVAREALEIARASAIAQREPVQLDDTEPIKDTYRTPFEEDPFSVSLDEKLRILLDADAAMARVEGVAIREGSMVAGRELKTFASLDGAWIEQEIVEAGGGIEVTAVNESEMQQRSYPNSFGGQSVTGGFEAVRALDLPAHGQEIAELAVALLDAPQCPSGEMDLVLDATQVALQIHESCGHPTELDRVFGTEASFAGTSFLTTDKLDSLHYGSSLINIDADATAVGGLGTFGYDDEGVPAQRAALVSEGVLSGYLTSRETAPRIGRRSMGSARAWTWSNIPLIRMTNINLRPGDAGSLEDLIADTDEGIFMSVNKSWSIDDRRLNFQFGDQAGWLIKNGKRTQLVKNPTYTGITPQFWGSCDAICGPDEWTLWGLPNCGKGEPVQTGHVGHGAAPARFRKVKVGVGRW
ncbi:MAG TPA: TldD/PmbA family protein [Candidatus Limnocylindria bacterium]|nr:TldD/PmbA family protein [Candidatus Limnocylindria bacterium]